MPDIQSLGPLFTYTGGLWLPLSSTTGIWGNSHIEFYLKSVLLESSDDWEISDPLVFWETANCEGPPCDCKLDAPLHHFSWLFCLSASVKSQTPFYYFEIFLINEHFSLVQKAE